MFLFGKRKNSVPDGALGRIEKEAKELRIENAVSMETLRRIEEKTQRLEELLQKESRERAVLREHQMEMEHTQERGQAAELQKFGKEIGRHNMAIENLLDVIEEEQERNRSGKLLERERKEEQDRLLSLVSVYQEQFWQMKRFFEERNESWAQQFALMEEELNQSMDRCGITPVDRTGVMVDYELHEVVQAVDTNDTARDRRVAEILSPGYLYQGKVRKKAKASVYRMVLK